MTRSTDMVREIAQAALDGRIRAGARVEPGDVIGGLGAVRAYTHDRFRRVILEDGSVREFAPRGGLGSWVDLSVADRVDKLAAKHDPTTGAGRRDLSRGGLGSWVKRVR